jgi:hypothetical protein
VPCVVGTTTLAQAALPVGSCESALASLRRTVRGALGSVYVCNSADCNADGSLLLLQPPSSGGAAVPYAVTATLNLFGYTAATFGAQASAQFADVMRRRLNVDAVEVVGTARRRLLVDASAASFVRVTFRVLTATPDTLSAAIVALVNSDSFVAALQAGGLTSASSVVMRDAPSTERAPTASEAAPALACSVLVLAAALATLVV